MKNISRIDLLLDDKYQEYNYIKVARSETDNYYYYLDSMDFYNNQLWTFKYKIDILRTLKEKEMLSHDVNVARYSNLLDMTDQQKAYFWNNQDTKLGANLIEDYKQTAIPYDDSETNQKVWKNMKWLYIWLQPRITQSDDINGTPQIYQYKFTKRITESIITVTKESDLPIYKTFYKYKYPYDVYPKNQLYYITETNKYYRVVEKIGWYQPEGGDYGSLWWTKVFEVIDGFNTTDTTYYLHTIPTVAVPDVPNSLYCLVVPLSTVKVIRNYIESGIAKQTVKRWGASEIIPYLFDVGSDNNWNDYIVDFKISIMPPLELNNSFYQFVEAAGAEETPYPAVWIPRTIAGNDFSPLKNLSEFTVKVVNNAFETPQVFFPFIKSKPNTIMEMESTFVFPEMNKENIIQKKFYLSIAEQRQELDIANLYANNAKKLYYFEDIFPGRTNVMYGFAPEDLDIKERIYFLTHSPSTLFLDRDTSLPIFTSNYQSYLASNKNFVQQAQLQRSSELVQSLIGSGSSAVGATAVAQSLPGYSPYAAAANAAGKTVNALITYGVQTKQFHWAVDNMKAAPGNYKAATTTLSLMLPFDIFTPWIEVYKSNDFDIDIYNKLINDIGYEYFDFSYNLDEIIQNAFTGTDNKKFLQAILTGLTNNVAVNLALINILFVQLQEGINIMINAE